MSLIFLSWILFSVLSITTKTDAWSDYCDVTCRGQEHTVCKRQDEDCGPGSSCDEAETDMDDDLRQMILDKHNELRREVATGKSGQPKAANMNILRWNFELEYIAQCLANTCEFAHDKCRNTHENSVGQNLFTSFGTDADYVNNNNVVIKGIKDWYDEKKDMTEDKIDSFKSGGGAVIGHYTQLVWAEMEFVGCGRTSYKTHKQFPYAVYLVCNYMGTNAAGNMLGSKVYIKGEPCTQCGDKECNTDYPGLCGRSVRVEDEEGRNKARLQTGIVSKYSIILSLLIFGVTHILM